VPVWESPRIDPAAAAEPFSLREPRQSEQLPAAAEADSAWQPRRSKSAPAPEPVSVSVPVPVPEPEPASVSIQEKLDQIKDLYVTAEAIGEDALTRHFDQLRQRQRALISEYFERAGLRSGSTPTPLGDDPAPDGAPLPG
jgi:hypothetical protein